MKKEKSQKHNKETRLGGRVFTCEACAAIYWEAPGDDDL